MLELERKYLLISAIGNVVVGCAGLAAFPITGSQAILLDGLFNITYFATGLFTIKVAALVADGDDDRFPHGYAFFEPLINGIKGMLVLGVSLMAMVGAIQALFEGGRNVAAGTAIAYGVFATIVCCAIAAVSCIGVKKTNSPLVRADAENWIVNAAISSCVLLAFIGIFLLRFAGFDSLVPYVDPSIVLVVVAISIIVPVRMSSNALMALLNRAPKEGVVRQVTEIVDASLAELPVEERFIRVTQPGRQRMVLVHVVLPNDYQHAGLSAIDAVRKRTYDALREAHVATIVDVVFTADRQWGAPSSDGGMGGPSST